MSIIHNLQDISTVTIGSENIENIYLGEDLLWTAETSPYTPDQVIFEQSTAGTYSLDILADGQYEVYCIGGGAGGAGYGRRQKVGKIYLYTTCAASGGSGSGFIGIIQISAGTYNIVIGNNGGGSGNEGSGGAGGNSSIGSLVTTYGAVSHNYATAGSGGSAPSINTTVISQTLNSAGNNGSVSVNSAGTVNASGAVSVYNNYGAGGSGYGTATSSTVNGGGYAGTAGYVKIVYKRK